MYIADSKIELLLEKDLQFVDLTVSFVILAYVMYNVLVLLQKTDENIIDR
jgi:hypothetical protein